MTGKEKKEGGVGFLKEISRSSFFFLFCACSLFLPFYDHKSEPEERDGYNTGQSQENTSKSHSSNPAVHDCAVLRVLT